MPGCPILLAFFATGPALSEAEGVGILTLAECLDFKASSF